MKNLEKICMLIAFVSASVSFGISLSNHTSCSWQFCTMVWIIISYLKLSMNERQSKIIEKLTK